MRKPYDLDALTNEVRRLLATRTHGLSLDSSGELARPGVTWGDLG